MIPSALTSTTRLLIIPLLTVVLMAISCASFPDEDSSNKLGHPLFTEDTGFTSFGLEGGYGAGSVVRLEQSLELKNVPVVKNLQIVVLDKDWDGLESATMPFVRKTYDYTNEFLGTLEVNASSTLKATGISESIERLDFTIDEADRHIVTLPSLLQHIAKLNQNKRATLKQFFSSESDNELALLTEVLAVKKAEIVVHFRESVDADIQANVIAWFSKMFGKATVSGKEERKTILSYGGVIPVGFKSKDKIAKAIRHELSKRRFYRDQDSDGFGGKRENDIRFALKKPAGYSERTGDCVNNDPNVFPGQGRWFDKPNAAGNYDYNCDGKNTKRYNSGGSCRSRCSSAHTGWYGPIPACGDRMNWLDDCDFKLLKGCIKETSKRQQVCR